MTPFHISRRMLLVLSAFLWAIIPGEAAGRGLKAEPKSMDAAAIPKLIRSLPKYVGFGFTGAAYRGGSLYLGCNLGLLVLKDHKPVVLYQWMQADAVVEGPWLDAAADVLWAQLDNDGSWVRFDGTHWLRVALPEPPAGYNRGDMLAGFRGMSGAGNFWIVGGGLAWRWDGPNVRMLMEPMPAMPEGSGLKAFFRLGAASVYYARDGYEIGFGGGNNPATAYVLSDKWDKFSAEDASVGQATIIGETGYFMAESGALFQITRERLTRLAAPGDCDAITRTSGGELLASFKQKGIYRWVGGRWEFVVQPPAETGVGKHWVYLAENSGEIAFVTAPIPDLQAPSDPRSLSYKTVFTATAGIWIYAHGKFEKIDLGQ